MMNTILKHSILFTSFAVLLTACKTEALPEAQSDGTVMRVAIPENLTKVSMTDRTASGGGMALAWEAGDKLRVISGGKSEVFTIKDGFSAHMADFTGNAVSGSSFDIIYPGSFVTLSDVMAKSYAGQTQNGNGSTAHLAYHAWLSGVDNYSEVAFTDEWAAAHGGTLSRCGVLKISIVLPSSFSVVTKAALSAPSAIFYQDNGATAASNELSVNLEGVDVSANGGLLTAYMNIPAKDITLEQGLELSVKVTGEGGSEYVQKFTMDKTVVMQGGKICTIRLEPEVVTVLTDYYVSVSGSGEMTGADASNAIGLSQLKSLLRTVVIGQGDTQAQAASNANAEKLDGVTFHFADGNYMLPDAENEKGLKIEYSGYSKQVEITFEGSGAAILSGGGLYRVLTIGNQVALSIKGMKIADGFRSDESGGGILLAAGGSGNATLKLNGTIFDNNIVGTSSSGGAIRCSKGKLIAENCVFGTGNYGRNGGSIYTDNTGAEATFIGCTFKSHSYNTGGASNNSNGTQIFRNCRFEGCYTEVEKGNGGAIHANGPTAKVVVDGCTFYSCKASTANPMESSTNKGAGIISVQQAEFSLDGCTFDNCEAVTGALIFLQSGGTGEKSGGWLKCNNTKFINNRVSDRGLIQANGSKSNKQGAIGFFNNCVFSGNTMRTNQWGFILHGGNPGIACFNNCTIYGNTRQQDGGNSVLLNNDGLIIFTNSTLIGAADLVAVRNTDASNDARVLLANSIIINTSSPSSLVYGPVDKMKCPLFVYNNIMGPAVDETDVTIVGDSNVKDAALATLTGGAFDETTGVFAWNGPENSFAKMTPTGFESAVKNSLNVKYDAFNAYIGDKTLGEFYYGWLSEIGAIGKDALGTDRGSAWWPGAYQKNL